VDGGTWTVPTPEAGKDVHLKYLTLSALTTLLPIGPSTISPSGVLPIWPEQKT
jgi:hypothetical protein